MFPKNILTFNPGWDSNAKTLESFTDIRDIQKTLKDANIKIEQEAKEGTEPASLTITDPDGNTVLIDQHVPRSK